MAIAETLYGLMACAGYFDSLTHGFTFLSQAFTLVRPFDVEVARAGGDSDVRTKIHISDEEIWRILKRC